MWNKNAWYKKTLLTALTLLILVPASVLAEEEGGEGDSASSEDSTGHWYVGGSTGYLRPDGDRMGGNTRTIGVQGGYQFSSDRWSVDLGFQEDAFSPGSDRLRTHSLSLTRYWGDDFRFLVEFGHTHISLDGDADDRSTAGFHIGAGLSAFITDNWELRGDAKLVQTRNGQLLDGLGTLSLNYHFVEAKPAVQEEEPVLGESTAESLPPMEYRESEEPVVEAAPAPQPAPEPVAPAVIVPKFTHTLVNFGFNSIDIEAQYGGQLDQISEEIKGTNSKAVIEGHTDSVGSDKSNKVLSMDRAIMVKRELKKRGVEGADLQVVGHGEEQPIATNETEEGRRQNRRVEVKVYDK